MKNSEPRTISEMAAEIAEHEKAAAAKRVELQAAQEAENLRRAPLLKLLAERERLVATIDRNKKSIADHAEDATEFEKLLDDFFKSDQGKGTRCYNFAVPTLSFPFAVASAIVARLNERLAKSERDFADLEGKIRTEANALGLEEMLPTGMSAASD